MHRGRRLSLSGHSTWLRLGTKATSGIVPRWSDRLVDSATTGIEHLCWDGSEVILQLRCYVLGRGWMGRVDGSWIQFGVRVCVCVSVLGKLGEEASTLWIFKQPFEVKSSRFFIDAKWIIIRRIILRAISLNIFPQSIVINNREISQISLLNNFYFTYLK